MPPSSDQSLTRADPPEPVAPVLPIQPLPPGLSFQTALELLLRNPAELLARWPKVPQAWRFLLLLALVGFAIFGIVAGTFTMDGQLWAAPVKNILGFGLSCLLCFPSLHIFACLARVPVNLATLARLLLACSAMTAVMLLGLAPIVWVFSQSTDWLPLVGFLHLAAWVVALSFGLEVIYRLAKTLGATSTASLRLWGLLFFLVLMQMSTTLRPIVGSRETFLDSERKFFLQHWMGGARAK